MSNENSVLFSLTHLKRLAAPSGGGAALTITHPLPMSGSFVPLAVMQPMLMEPRRAWSGRWLIPTALGLASLLAVTLGVLFVLVLRPAPLPVAVPAAAPALVPLAAALPAPPSAPAVPSVATAPLDTAPSLPAASEASAAPATEAVAPAQVSKKRKLSKAAQRKLRRSQAARWAKLKRRSQKTFAARSVQSRGSASRRSPRNELDDIIDAAIQ